MGREVEAQQVPTSELTADSQNISPIAEITFITVYPQIEFVESSEEQLTPYQRRHRQLEKLPAITALPENSRTRLLAMQLIESDLMTISCLTNHGVTEEQKESIYSQTHALATLFTLMAQQENIPIPPSLEPIINLYEADYTIPPPQDWWIDANLLHPLVSHR